MSTRRVASCTSVLPQAPKKSPRPPKVPQPKLNTGTISPELPSFRNSIGHRCPAAKTGCSDPVAEEGLAVGRQKIFRLFVNPFGQLYIQIAAIRMPPGVPGKDQPYPDGDKGLVNNFL